MSGSTSLALLLPVMVVLLSAASAAAASRGHNSISLVKRRGVLAKAPTDPEGRRTAAAVMGPGPG